VSDAADDVIAVVRGGARGYVTKNISGEDLLDAVRRVADGDAVFSPRLAGFVLDAFASGTCRCRTRSSTCSPPRARGHAPHRPRLHLPRGRPRAVLSVKTVETHVSAVLRKLQLSNRRELARWAAARHLV
jgi:DNA-binding NarL/FixJ family response regulator